jgi:hypothetical protein
MVELLCPCIFPNTDIQSGNMENLKFFFWVLPAKSYATYSPISLPPGARQSPLGTVLLPYLPRLICPEKGKKRRRVFTNSKSYEIPAAKPPKWVRRSSTAPSPGKTRHPIREAPRLVSGPYGVISTVNAGQIRVYKLSREEDKSERGKKLTRLPAITS